MFLKIQDLRGLVIWLQCRPKIGNKIISFGGLVAIVE